MNSEPEIPIEEIINRIDVSENTPEDLERLILHYRRTLAHWEATGKPIKDKPKEDTTSIMEALAPKVVEPPKFRRI